MLFFMMAILEYYSFLILSAYSHNKANFSHHFSCLHQRRAWWCCIWSKNWIRCEPTSHQSGLFQWVLDYQKRKSNYWQKLLHGGDIYKGRTTTRFLGKLMFEYVFFNNFSLVLNAKQSILVYMQLYKTVLYYSKIFLVQ